MAIWPVQDAKARFSELYEDAMIAAMAKVHQLTVVTRNVSGFRRFDVPLLDPCVVSRSQP